MGKKLDLDKSKIINLYTKEKKSSEKIGELFGCSNGPILRILKENKINLSRKGKSNPARRKLNLEKNPMNNLKTREKASETKKRLYKEGKLKVSGCFKGGYTPLNKKNFDDKKIIRLYLEEKKSCKEISKIFNCSSGPILRILKENNINTSRKGRKFSEEHRKNLSKIKTKLFSEGKLIISHSKETRKKLSESKKGENNPMYGIESWNKNLTKENDERLKQAGEKTSKTRKKLFKEGKLKSPMEGKNHTKETIEKFKLKRREWITPLKDTSIEVKIQNFLKNLRIEFYTHQYMKIENGYQCDIWIPSKNLVIECDGDYWHGNPKYFPKLTERQREQKERDDLRTKQLLEKGFRVIRLWENKIKEMSLEDFKEKIEVKENS